MRTVLSIAVVTIISTSAAADVVTVTVENIQKPGGFSFTPVWVGFHDGSFSSFGPGQSASLFDGVEAIAELGNSGPISARFGASQPFGVQGTIADLDGAPVFSPGESRSVDFDVTSARNGFFSFMSMVVPSNDLFIGNPVAIQLFNGGSFVGPVTIEIHGSSVWDAGTEVNDLLDGGAFAAGVDATLGSPEDGVIHLLYSDGGAQAYLDGIVGTRTPDGGTIGHAFTPETLLGRITIVPAPGAPALLVAAAILGRRRRAPRD